MPSARSSHSARRRHSNVSRVGWCALVLSALGIIFFFAQPALIRLQTHQQFDKFGMQSAAERVAEDQIQSMATDRIIGLVLSAIGVAAAAGILKRKRWSRNVWVTLCVLWIAPLVFFTFRDQQWNFVSVSSIVIRCFVLWISTSVLFRAESRNEFAPAHEDAKHV